MHDFEYPTAAAVKYEDTIAKGIDHLDATTRLVNRIFKQRYSHNLPFNVDEEKAKEAKKDILKELASKGLESGYVTNKGKYHNARQVLRLLLEPGLKEISYKLRHEKLIPRDILQFTSDDWKILYKYLNPESFLWGESLSITCYGAANASRLIVR